MTIPKKPHVPMKRASAVAMAERVRVFTEAYIANGGNGTDAAILAGYSPKTAPKTAVALLQRPEVLLALRKRQDVVARKHELTTDAVIGELSKIVHSDIRKLFKADGTMLPVKDWPDDVAGMVASIEIDEIKLDKKVIGHTKKVKLWDKNSAIEKAMKHLGLFERDNVQRQGALADLPRDVLKAMLERLKQLNAVHGSST